MSENIIAASWRIGKNRKDKVDAIAFSSFGPCCKKHIHFVPTPGHLIANGLHLAPLLRGLRMNNFYIHLNPQSYREICVMRADGSDKRLLTDNQLEELAIGWMPLVKKK